MVVDSSSLKDALISVFGSDCQVVSRQSVSGGDINVTSLLQLSGGQRVFLKENRKNLAEMFVAEASGLEALADIADSSDSPPVPKPLATGTDDSRAFLMLEEVSPGRLSNGTDFGRSLAILHREGRSAECGFTCNNWIGSTPQSNPLTGSWPDFFAEHRLLYQWHLARRKGYGDSKTERQMESTCRKLPDILPSPDELRPSLLHGDLWGGNWIAGADGQAWLIDPAVYYGHRETDLAMTRLFGGFPVGFQHAYQEEWPLEPDFDERVDLYNLYHVLNHLNLFGESYWGGVRHSLSIYS